MTGRIVWTQCHRCGNPTPTEETIATLELAVCEECWYRLVEAARAREPKEAR